MTRFITSEQAAQLISNNATIGISSFGGWFGPDLILKAIRDRFKDSEEKANLKIFSGISPGNLTENDLGMNILADKNLIESITAAHVGMPAMIGKMVSDNTIPCHGLPLGVVGDLLRAAASKKPGVITKIGMGTFCDPEIDGGAMNEKGKALNRKVADKIEIDNEPYLFYRAPKIDICIIRASICDENGNVSTLKDPITGDQFDMVMATKANGGTVIVQIDKVVPAGTLHPKSILLHKSVIDFIVVDQEKQCTPGYDCHEFRPELCGEINNIEKTQNSEISLDHRKICSRRGALELKSNSIVNLGIGLPEGVSEVVREENISDQITLSVESGPIGGIPIGGASFGASINAEVEYRLNDNLSFYDGGGLDIAILGAGEIDKDGNVNVSKFGKKTTGPGGFINIVQSTKNLIFMCSFTASGLKTKVTECGDVKIITEGRNKKFKEKINHITFSADFAKNNDQNVLYITERAVFKLTDSGLELIEIAPGIDIERDILSQMEFKPMIVDNVKVMDKRIFKVEPMGLLKN